MEDGTPRALQLLASCAALAFDEVLAEEGGKRRQCTVYGRESWY
eukprot:gene3238-12632_t